MSRTVPEKEFKSLMSLPPKARYEYFVKKVADWEEIWSLWNDGWVLMGDKELTETVPVWPHSIYAKACAVNEWSGYTPKSISVDDWLNKWIPGMAKDGRMVGVFPTTQGETVTVDPLKLKADLEEELAKYQ